MKLMLSASSVQELCKKVDDVMRVKGEYDCLYIRKDDDGIWRADIDYPGRDVYIGLVRNG